ncbi:MAG: FmdB family zinc ribbon protein [Verrucomicrobiota bacterium]
MPTYVYQIIREDAPDAEPDPDDVFEIQQPISAPALTHHPETGEPVRRIYSAPNLPTRYNAGATKQKLSGKNLAAHGFTRYERDRSTGTYHRTAGRDGPAQIERPAD